MSQDQQLVNYIKSSLAQGKTKEELYQELLKQGWTIDAIQEHFGAVESAISPEDAQKKTIRIILLIGTVLIGAGVFSFIAANWEEMTKTMKVIVITAAMVGVYGAAWYVKEKLNYDKTGDALYLLGAIIYGAGIFLVGQMFHIRENWPDGFILWMIGAILMGFAVDTFLLFFLAVAVGVVAIIGHPFNIFATVFGQSSFLLTSSLLLLVATAVTFFAGWRIRKRLPSELTEFY